MPTYTTALSLMPQPARGQFAHAVWAHEPDGARRMVCIAFVAEDAERIAALLAGLPTAPPQPAPPSNGMRSSRKAAHRRRAPARERTP